MTNVLRESRIVARKFLARPQNEGVGAMVRRSIGRFELKYFDPFLVLDEFSVSAPGGFPDHPHRGLILFVFVFLLFHPIDSKRSPTCCRIEPGYQEITSKDILEAAKDGVKVRVIAGEAFGTKSPVYTRTPTMFLDITLNPGSHLHQPIPVSWNAFVYVLEGEGIFGNSISLPPVTAHHLLLLGGGGDGLDAWNKSAKPLRFVLVGGEPLGEPVAQFGPFVMNSQEEIDQAIKDYENGVNGFEKASQWRSEATLGLDF
ncbi:hypothetical protein U1Q18_000334 [Sarracenia purpurea var. burkii]